MAIFTDVFRNPLGDGLITPENDGDGYYVAQDFGEFNATIGSYHLGADWNGEDGGNSDLGDPVYAIANATVIEIVEDQSASTTGFGNYVILRHDFSEPTLINGQSVTHVQSLYAHLDTVEALAVGQEIEIGQQIGTLGMSGYADVAHLHLEITLGDTLPTSRRGYNPAGAELPWLDPVSFTQSNLTPAAPTLTTSEIIEIGMALARASYGGSAISAGGTDEFGPFRGTLQGTEDPLAYDDDYRHYVASWSNGPESWQLLAQQQLHVALVSGTDWTADGLYRGTGWIGEDDGNQGEALVALRTEGGVRTLVLAFRGSDGPDALSEGQTFTSEGLHSYYEGLRPLIEAIAVFVSSNGIENVIVSGHSLGATIVDHFARTSAALFSGTNLSLVSVASAGLPSADATPPLSGVIDNYIGISHSEDRVHFPDLQPTGDELTPTHTLLLNTQTSLDYLINLPNLNNSEVFYEGRAWYEFDHGFGAEHNGELYWTNLAALTNDTLFSRLGSHQITMGLTDYAQVRDLNGADLPSFQSYTSINNYRYFDDSGLRALLGTNAADYILGLDGDDRLIGYAGDDLLSGGNGGDQIDGRAGSDVLSGGAGVDQLAGGTQGDVFVFSEDDYPFLQWENPDRITDFNQGNTGTFSASEGDLIDLSHFHFNTTSGSGTSSTVRLVSIAASEGLPTGALLEINTGDGNWRGIARLDNVTSGQSVLIALTDEESDAHTGNPFVVDEVGNGTTWSVSPATRNVAEDDVTITFTITRSGTRLGDETVYVSTVQNQGFYNDGDYVGRTNVAVSFAEGNASESFSVRINADAFTETDETFGLIVQADPNDPISTSLASATFTIEDGSMPSVSGDTYVGDSLDNAWSGGASADLAFGLSGDDTLSGLGGDDTLVGGDGTDLLNGGSGDDVLLGGRGAMSGGAGNDVVDIRGAQYINAGSFAAHLVTVTSRVDAGDGNDQVLVGPGDWGSPHGNAVLDGGAGFDQLTIDMSSVDASNSSSASSLRWDFNRDGTFDQDLTLLENSLASGGTIRAYTGYRDNNYITSWIDIAGFEAVHYRGGAHDDLFVGNADLQVLSARGGAGTDTLMADWSAGTSNIVWNMTLDNETEETLGNGVVVQSIERVVLRTGSGNDNLVLGSNGGRVETGAGDDVVDIRGAYYINTSSFSTHLVTVTSRVDAGDGNDQVLAGPHRSGSPHGNAVLNGGAGFDQLTIDMSNVDASNSSSASSLRWDFNRDGSLDQDFALFESSVEAGGTIRAYIGYLDNNYITSWIDIAGFEAVHYRGGAHDDLFVGNADLQVLSARGGAGTDTLMADWSAGTSNIVWNMTLDNETEETLGNGVVVQSIERVVLRTGAGNDNLVLGDQDDHVETGAGNDTISTGGGDNYIDGGSGTDQALFSGRISAYLIDTVGDTTTVTRINNGQTDTILNVEELVFDDQFVSLVAPSPIDGTLGDDVLVGSSGHDTINGFGGNDLLRGNAGDDVLSGGEGTDTLIGGDGNDTLTGGTSMTDLRDVVYAGDGDDRVDGGYGNDELRGDSGNDTIAGGFGSDTMFGGAGDDVLAGSALSDQIFGSDGNDFINGGFGSDRVNGGAGADRFYHLGVAGHGSDWIQDFSDNDRDLLVYGGTSVSIDNFQVNVAETANAGTAGVEEAFVIYRPTGQILWALVDGAAQSSIMISIAGTEFDLLASSI